MHFLALSYLLGLGAILWMGVKSSHLHWSRALIAIFLLLWAVLILTAQVLSLFAAINVTWAYIGLSMLIAVAISAGLRLIVPERDLTFREFPSPFGPRLTAYVSRFLIVTGALAVLGNLVLAYGLLPANADSIVYRFPRAYWYFGSGSLRHFSNVADPRAIYYPFNGTLGYLPLIHFRWGPNSFSLPSLVCWIVVAQTTYLFARNLGGPRVAAAATAWLVALTPNVLVQALSTNDEILAAAPLLAGLFFLHRWFHGRQLFDVVLGAIGLGISAGTKLHVSFYWPLLLAIVIALVVHHRTVAREARAWLNGRALTALAVTATVVVVLSFSFVFYNFLATGHLMNWDFSAQLLNQPFSLRAAIQTPILYASQIVLTPVADLHLAFGSASRAEHYAAFNAVLAPLFRWVDNGPDFVSVGYRFTGVNSASAVVFNEQTLFIGFTWLIALIAGITLAGRRWPDGLWARFHLAALPVWFLSFAASTRYIEGFTVYLGYAVIVSGPALVYAFAPIGRRGFDRFRWVVVTLVFAAHAYLAVSILFTSSPRNLIVLARASHLPLSRGFASEKSVQEEVARATSGVYSHSFVWGQPYWATMAYHPEIRQLLRASPEPAEIPSPLPSDPDPVAFRYSRFVLMPTPDDQHLHVYQIPQWPAWGYVAFRIPDKSSPGLTWVGNLNFSLGPEWLFATGNGVETRYPGRDRYIALNFYELSAFCHDAKPILKIAPIIYGLGPREILAFRYEIRINGTLVDRTDWNRTSYAELSTVGLGSDNGVLTIFVRNEDAGGTVTSADVLLRSTKSPEAASSP
jgi:hypothetical protein